MIGDIIQGLASLLAIVVAVGSLVITIQRNKTLKKVDNGTINETENRAIILANQRALDAETRRSESEKREDVLEARITKMEIDVLEQTKNIEAIANYRLTFDVSLGKKPSIYNPTIESLPSNV